jgi:hypothetical protein
MKVSPATYSERTQSARFAHFGNRRVLMSAYLWNDLFSEECIMKCLDTRPEGQMRGPTLRKDFTRSSEKLKLPPEVRPPQDWETRLSLWCQSSQSRRLVASPSFPRGSASRISRIPSSSSGEFVFGGFVSRVCHKFRRRRLLFLIPSRRDG